MKRQPRLRHSPDVMREFIHLVEHSALPARRFPTDLEKAIGSFIHYYNEQCHHESLDKITPADDYFGRP